MGPCESNMSPSKPPRKSEPKRKSSKKRKTKSNEKPAKKMQSSKRLSIEDMLGFDQIQSMHPTAPVTSTNDEVAEFCLKTSKQRQQQEVCSFQDLIDNNQNEEWDDHNQESHIYKVSTKKKQKLESQQPPGQNVPGSVYATLASSDPEVDDKISVSVSQVSRSHSAMLFSMDKVDMQFILPCARAGPLVVPFINYNEYYHV